MPKPFYFNVTEPVGRKNLVKPDGIFLVKSTPKASLK